MILQLGVGAGTHMNRIMVVDDEPDLLRMVEMYLKAWHFEVDGFSDPIKALTYFQNNPTFFSLVLTDIRMPKMSGLELAQHILQIKPEIKVMFMTAFQLDTLDFKRSLPALKYEDILKKPFRLKDVCGGVKKQLEVTPGVN